MGILISHLLCDLSGRLVRLAQEFFSLCQHVLQVIYSTNVFCIFWLKIALK